VAHIKLFPEISFMKPIIKKVINRAIRRAARVNWL
jgi:hypothetical protein